MLNNKPARRLILTLAISHFSLTANALPFVASDARTAAMGGTGVASATGPTAGLSNPAMLAWDKDTKVGFSLPAGGFASDRNQTIDQIDALQATGGELKAFSDADISDPRAYSSAAEDLADGLSNISGNFVRAGASLGAALLLPLPKSRLAFTATAQAYASATPTIAANDLQALRALSDLGTTVSNCSTPPKTCVNGALFQSSDITSSGDILLISVAELGLSFSTNTERFSWGVTPKIQRISGLQYSQTFSDSDGFNSDSLTDATHEQTSANIDAGIAWAFDEQRHWVVGLTGHNLIKQSLELEPNGNNGNQAIQEIIIEPQLRSGLAYRLDRLTLALDVDLTENSGITKQDTSETSQFVAFGAEYSLANVAFRAGFRSNLAESNIDDVASVGMGLFNILQFALAGNNEDLSGMLQLGFQI